MSIGAYTIVKNERPWIGPFLASWLPWLDQISLFDGNSTDGTLEIIRDFINRHPHGYKIKLTEDKDPKNLQQDYVKLFNECMWALDTDWAAFLHPDMIPVNPEAIKNIGDGIAYYSHMDSYAGEPGGALLKINGRMKAWKNIYRLRNPNLGAHYFGFYGAANEDTYFSEITGDNHDFHNDFTKYPYEVKDSGLKVMHFSDVRPYERRLDRMIKCLLNQNYAPEVVEAIAKNHPRVNFKDCSWMTFEPAEYPEIFKTWNKEKVLV